MIRFRDKVLLCVPPCPVATSAEAMPARSSRPDAERLAVESAGPRTASPPATTPDPPALPRSVAGTALKAATATRRPSSSARWTAAA